MNPTEIEFAVKALISKRYDPATFVFDLVAIYNAPKITVSKLKSGQTNLAKIPGDVLWKKHLYFRPASPSDDVAAIGDYLLLEQIVVKQNPRFIFITDGERVHIRDRKLDDTCNTDFSRLDESSDFLLPLAGYERRAAAAENPADLKAAKRLAKLYDALLAANPTWSAGNHTHELNLFLTRILFCFYAEDTGIFDAAQIFTSTISQYTSEDGSDVAKLLERVFLLMNQRAEERSNPSAIDARFPYVNGSLFESVLQIPHFNRTARRLFIECGELDWKTINPDIFGSMIQTVAEPGARGEIGMHYTSVPNIMKVLGPLFLDDLNETYERAKDSSTKLLSLLARLSSIHIFDPACGSGNFLIIAYKELRQLEMRVLGRLAEITPDNPLRLSGISLQHFAGLDIVDFACETAKLSLWIAEYQMNSAFKELFGTSRPPLPLGKITTIMNANALTYDWANIFEAQDAAELYVCGNPPYIGTSMQTPLQKSELADIFRGIDGANANLDYIAGWLYKGSQFVRARAPRATVGFVTTNSVCQGEHIPLLWPSLLSEEVELAFAHTSFKWDNSAAHNAGVSCIILGLGPKADNRKRLYTDGTVQACKEISPYLLPFGTPIVSKRTVPISKLPTMTLGSQPTDGGNLLFTPDERRALLLRHPEAGRFLRKYVGSKEFVRGIERWSLWITDDEATAAAEIPEIKRRLDRIVAVRMKSGTRAKPYVRVPHRYVLSAHQEGASLFVPTVTSETRRYLTIGLLDGGSIISNLAYAVYNPPRYLLSVLSSRLHRLWTTTIGGHLETRIRYSNQYVYNTFPIPDLSTEQKRILSEHSKEILRARARHPGKTVAWLYNPETMPDNVKHAHLESDEYLETYVYGRQFKDDTQRLEHLFGVYSAMKTREDTPLLAEPFRTKPTKASV